MTILKSADDKQPQLDALEALLARTDLTASQRKAIDAEIRTVKAGIAGEQDAAYEIDFEYRHRKSYVVMHDLRIEFGGRVAQIDHLILHRILDGWVCETKSFKQGVKINEQGEWLRYGPGPAQGMPSPVVQNRHHVDVLNDLFANGGLRLPKRVITLKPRWMPVVLVSNNARIDRPPKKYWPSIEGLDTVMKVEQLAKHIDKAYDERSSVKLFGKLVSTSTIEDIGRQLIELHRPAHVDYHARFGIAQGAPAPAVPIATPNPASSSSERTTCEVCGKPLSPKVLAYLEENHAAFGGAKLCFDCQRLHRRSRRSADSKNRATAGRAGS